MPKPLTTTLLHDSGQMLSSTVATPMGKKQDAQAVGSAITYLRRYALQSIMGLPVEDDDGNAASRRTVQPRSLPSTQTTAARIASELEALRLISYRGVWLLDKGIAPTYENSITKVFFSELEQRISGCFLEIAGLYGSLRPGSKWVPLNGNLSREYQHAFISTIAAGSSEIQRSIIALRGLGLPRE